jgi:hypothetical protein
MINVKKISVRRTRRIDAIISLRQEYKGDVHTNPETYNRAFADILRRMADAIADVKNAWVDPEVVVWLHEPGKISAEVGLSPPVARRRK